MIVNLDVEAVSTKIQNQLEYYSDDEFKSRHRFHKETVLFLLDMFSSDLHKCRQFSTSNSVINCFAFFRSWSFPSYRWRSIAV